MSDFLASVTVPGTWIDQWIKVRKHDEDLDIQIVLPEVAPVHATSSQSKNGHYEWVIRKSKLHVIRVIQRRSSRTLCAAQQNVQGWKFERSASIKDAGLSRCGECIQYIHELGLTLNPASSIDFAV